jgi:hypothetical protein
VQIPSGCNRGHSAAQGTKGRLEPDSKVFIYIHLAGQPKAKVRKLAVFFTFFILPGGRIFHNDFHSRWAQISLFLTDLCVVTDRSIWR